MSLKQIFRCLADNTNSASYANRLRKKRMEAFELFFPEVQSEKLRILDLGGTWDFWNQMGYTKKNNLDFTLLNLTAPQLHYEHFTSVAGNACDLNQFADSSFDIVFSNSVIEHVGGLVEQEKMAKEIMRVGKSFFIQTPNYYFPLEPHFLIPGYQWLPLSLRAFLLRHFRCGWYEKIKDKNESLTVARSIRLLTKKELMELFPFARLKKEKYFGLTKSFMIFNR